MDSSGERRKLFRSHAERSASRERRMTLQEIATLSAQSLVRVHSDPLKQQGATRRNQHGPRSSTEKNGPCIPPSVNQAGNAPNCNTLKVSDPIKEQPVDDNDALLRAKYIAALEQELKGAELRHSEVCRRLLDATVLRCGLELSSEESHKRFELMSEERLDFIENIVLVHLRRQSVEIAVLNNRVRTMTMEKRESISLAPNPTIVATTAQAYVLNDLRQVMESQHLQAKQQQLHMESSLRNLFESHVAALHLAVSKSGESVTAAVRPSEQKLDLIYRKVKDEADAAIRRDELHEESSRQDAKQSSLRISEMTGALRLIEENVRELLNSAMSSRQAILDDIARRSAVEERRWREFGKDTLNPMLSNAVAESTVSLREVSSHLQETMERFQQFAEKGAKEHEIALQRASETKNTPTLALIERSMEQTSQVVVEKIVASQNLISASVEKGMSQMSLAMSEVANSATAVASLHRESEQKVEQKLSALTAQFDVLLERLEPRVSVPRVSATSILSLNQFDSWVHFMEDAADDAQFLKCQLYCDAVSAHRHFDREKLETHLEQVDARSRALNEKLLAAEHQVRELSASVSSGRPPYELFRHPFVPSNALVGVKRVPLMTMKELKLLSLPAEVSQARPASPLQEATEKISPEKAIPLQSVQCSVETKLPQVLPEIGCPVQGGDARSSFVVGDSRDLRVPPHVEDCPRPLFVNNEAALTPGSSGSSPHHSRQANHNEKDTTRVVVPSNASDGIAHRVSDAPLVAILNSDAEPGEEQLQALSAKDELSSVDDLRETNDFEGPPADDTQPISQAARPRPPSLHTSSSDVSLGSSLDDVPLRVSSTLLPAPAVVETKAAGSPSVPLSVRKPQNSFDDDEYDATTPAKKAPRDQALAPAQERGMPKEARPVKVAVEDDMLSMLKPSGGKKKLPSW